MTCDELDSLLPDYLGDELARDARGRVDEHLAACPACRAEVAGLSGALSAFLEAPEVTLAEAARLTADLEIRRRAPRPRRIVGAFLRVAAVLLVGLAAGWRLGTARPPAAAPDALPAEARDIHPGWFAAATQAFGSGGAPFPRSR